MKYLVLGIMGFFLTGCVSFDKVQRLDLESDILEAVPYFIRLNDVSGELKGWGIVPTDETLVFPDHLISDGDLFWNERMVRVAVRDFEHDLAIAYVPGLLARESVLRLSPPEIGKELYWFNGEKILASKVVSISGRFQLDPTLDPQKDLLVLKGVISRGDSGRPIFDHQKRIVGIWVAADKGKQEVYALRSDIIARYLKKTLEDLAHIGDYFDEE